MNAKPRPASGPPPRGGEERRPAQPGERRPSYDFYVAYPCETQDDVCRIVGDHKEPYRELVWPHARVSLLAQGLTSDVMEGVSMPYLRKTYYALALDPVHMGSGEMQMGRVDNPIVRDAASNLPKIPATSLAGVARTYTAMHYPEKYRRPVEVKPGVVGYASCADQTGPTGKKDGACGRVDCPVCIPYGFLQPGGRTSPSMVQTFDAFPLFFPAPSMLGPVWVTSPERLRELVQSGALEAKDVDIQLKPEHGFRLQTGLSGRRLNLGWLLLPVAVPASPLTPSGVARLKAANVPEEMLTRLVLVPDELFAQVVNNNLEVRTSTAIDRSTGAALTGALYTTRPSRAGRSSPSRSSTRTRATSCWTVSPFPRTSPGCRNRWRKDSTTLNTWASAARTPGGWDGCGC